MAYLRFPDADRERLGIEREWIEFDPETLTVAEAEALDEAGGDWSTFGDRGAKAMKGRLWVALRRAGIEVESLAELDAVDVLRVRSLADEPGKAEASEPDGSAT